MFWTVLYCNIATQAVYLVIFLLLKKIKVGLRNHHAVCLWTPPYQLLNAWTSLHEIWYVNHDTWFYLNVVFNKFLPSVYAWIFIILPLVGNSVVNMLPRQRIYTQEQRNYWTNHFLSSVSMRLILPRTCLKFPYGKVQFRLDVEHLPKYFKIFISVNFLLFCD
jgi:hypothetical protein